VDAAARQQLIAELCEFKGRGPATDAERRAGNFLAARLRKGGRQAEVVPTFVHPQHALVFAAHAALAVAGSVVGTKSPGIGFALVLIAATSLYLDANTRFYLLRRLFFRRGSQNIVSPGQRPEAPLRLILVAHYDTARTGWIYGAPTRLLNSLAPRTRVIFSPLRLLFWGGIAALLPILGAQMAKFDPGWIKILQLLPTAGLIVAVFALVDVALSEHVPGANDNASGVAAVLSAAEELDADSPANLDVWVVLPGAETCIAEGMRAFVRDPRAQLDRERTAIVNVTAVGSGPPRFEVSEGAFASIPLDRRLIELAVALADADDEKSGFGAEPVRTALVDDAMPAIVRKIPAITIRDGFLPPHHHLPSDTPENVDADSLTKATGFVVSLVRLLDREVGRGAKE
jgi:hypothetical protein